MNYTVFISTVKTEIERRVGGDVKLKIWNAVKNNGIQKTGLVFMKDQETMSPAIYLEEYYRQFEQGKRIEEIVTAIIGLYQEIHYEQTWKGEDISDYNRIKEVIAYRLIGQERNHALLSEVPHCCYLDLAIVFYLLLEVEQHGTATMLVRDEHLKMWGITREELIKQAEENTSRLLPVEFCSIESAIRDLSIMEGEEIEEEYLIKPKHMYVLTNEIRSFGAAVILYPETLRKLKTVLNESFYVLPSSVHEVIIVAESISMNSVELEEMVTEINETQVENEEILSNCVYYCDIKKEPELKIVSHRFSS